MPRIIYVEHETCELLCEVQDSEVPPVGMEVMIVPRDAKGPEYRNVLHVLPQKSYVEVRVGRTFEVPSDITELTDLQRQRLRDLVFNRLYPDGRVPYEFSDLMIGIVSQALFTAWRLSLMGGGHLEGTKSHGLVEEFEAVLHGAKPVAASQTLRSVGDLRRAIAKVSDYTPLLMRSADGIEWVEQACVEKLPTRMRLAPGEELQNVGISVLVIGAPDREGEQG